MLEHFNLDSLVNWLWAGITAFVGYTWKKIMAIESKTNDLELEIAKNYVTKQELKAVEDKLDHYYEITNNKLDKVNDNVLLILHNKLDK